MRILTVASEVPPVRSGVAVAADRIARGAAGAGHDVVVRSYADAPVLVRDRFRVSTLALGLRRRWLRTFDLVHLHGPAPSLSDVLLLRRAVGSVPIPVVYTHHFTVWGDGPAWLGLGYRAYDRIARVLARQAAVIVTTTQSYAERVSAPGGPPVRVIPWGVDLPPGPVERGERGPDEPLRVLVLGQMRRYKGHLVALDALRSLPDVQLTLAGDGPLAREISRAAEGVSSVRVVIGPSDDEVEALYRSHDVVLLPATNPSEAFGIVLVEGMVRGCVPVASDLPGLRDIAGPSGRLVGPGDPYSLRSTVLALASDRHELQQLSAASATRAGDLSWDRTVDAYLEVYAGAVEAGPG